MNKKDEPFPLSHLLGRKTTQRLPLGVLLVLITVVALVLGSMALYAPGAVASAPAPQQQAGAQFAPQQQAGDGCIEGVKVIVLRGEELPGVGWEIHAQPVGGGAELVTTTDGDGRFRFDALTPGQWRVWEIVQSGWVPEIPDSVVVTVASGTPCAQVAFKNRQATPTPTPTPAVATRIRGWVYQRTCETLVPLTGVQLDVWESDSSDPPDSIVQTVFSNGGFYNFHLPPPTYAFLHVIPSVPAGLEPVTASSPLGVVVSPTHIRFDFPTTITYTNNNFIFQEIGLVCETPTPTPTSTPTPTPTNTPTPTPTLTPTATPTPPRFGCIDGNKVDDLHVGLPGWEIHARPTGQNSPEYVQVTDGTGYFRFDNLSEGSWTVWEIMQDGWEPVTAPAFDVMVVAGQECTNVRFKNRQSTPTPTPTPTKTPTATPERHELYLPLIMKNPDVCEIGRIQVMANGVFYSFPLKPDGNVKSIAPLPWKSATDFEIVNYNSFVTWIQYQPYWMKQIGGYQFTYPGGHAGKEFSLFVWTDCGRLAIETEIDDPTPTPTPKVERQ